jgi:predicted outer membrane repeat protein
MYFKMAGTAITVLGGAAALCLGSVPAALAAPAQSTHFVPCHAYALHQAINNASSGDTLDLAPGCTYYLPDALPDITARLTIVGHHSTLARMRHAPAFSLLTVDKSANVTVLAVNFTSGGGYAIDDGGAIDNDGTLDVAGGTFSGNKADEEGGAIYNDGRMKVSKVTFTDNLAPFGGAIYNQDDANISVSSFTWNKAPTLYGDPGNSGGGGIYTHGYLKIADSGFLANSTGGDGGAIYTHGTLRGNHITITADHAGSDGGGIYNDGGLDLGPLRGASDRREDGNSATLIDSTVFGNQPDNCAPAGSVTGCFF